MPPPFGGFPDRLSADRLDDELVAAEEVLGLLAGEHAFGGADGTDAARPHGTGQLQALELGPVLQEPHDVSRIEGIPAA